MSGEVPFPLLLQPLPGGCVTHAISHFMSCFAILFFLFFVLFVFDSISLLKRFQNSGCHFLALTVALPPDDTLFTEGTI